MSHAIIRGKNGRRHEVDFGDSPLRVGIHASEETVEIFVEADCETIAEERRRFAIINVPRHLFGKATGEAARRHAERNGKRVAWHKCAAGQAHSYLFHLDQNSTELEEGKLEEFDAPQSKEC